MRQLTNQQRFVLFNTWSSAIDRCHNPANASFPHYGGRGIYVCDRWRDSFDAFVADLGPRPDKHSLDRINVNGPYAPENCRWATAYVQARNKRDTKLTEQDVADIREATLQGHPARAMSAFYDVTEAYIRKLTEDIRSRKTFNAPSAKITEAQVREIRARYANGENVQTLANDYGLKPRNTFYIVTNQIWKHVV